MLRNLHNIAVVPYNRNRVSNKRTAYVSCPIEKVISKHQVRFLLKVCGSYWRSSGISSTSFGSTAKREGFVITVLSVNGANKVWETSLKKTVRIGTLWKWRRSKSISVNRSIDSIRRFRRQSEGKKRCQLEWTWVSLGKPEGKLSFVR